MRINRNARLVEAYLGHRLNAQQLADLSKNRESAGPEWESDFERFTDPNAVSQEVDSVDLKGVLSDLGLQDRFGSLGDDEVWSAEDRALYRRLAHEETRLEGKEVSVSGNGNFTVTAHTIMEKWDRNGDLQLTPDEIDNAMSGGFYGQEREMADTPESAAALVTLREKMKTIESVRPVPGYGVSTHSLLTMESAEDGVPKLIRQSVEANFEKNLNRAMSLGEPKPLEQEAIAPTTIRQGKIGSCVMLSTLAGLPEENLRGMLQPQPEGGVLVAFADGIEEQIAEPTLAERVLHSSGEDGDRWPALFEIAMAQRLYQEGAGEGGDLRSAIDGIAPERAIAALAGKETDRRSLDEISVEETRVALAELTERDGPVICGSRPVARGDFIDVEKLHNGIENGHAYTVLGFDAETDEVTLRNPWGKGEWLFQDSPDDGIFTMPVRDFYTSFRWVAGVAE